MGSAGLPKGPQPVTPFVPLAITTRSGVRESEHAGAVVALAADGNVAFALGDPAVTIYPRSSMKPLQATAMVDAGLNLPPDLLALVCASHDGRPEHLDGVRSILARAGLDESALGNLSSLPLDESEGHRALREGRGPSPLQMNCSGKHAGMLLTSAVNGWSTGLDYLEPEHPVQRHITHWIPVLAGEGSMHIGVDGCGAPAHVLSLDALARAFRAIATGTAGPAGDTVARAMIGYPEMVGGPHRDVTALMRAVPGLVAKDGADGVFAAALPDGRAVAVKIADGAVRARIPVLVAALRALQVDLSALSDEVWRVPILGLGNPVGEVHPIGPLSTYWPPA